MADGRPPDNVLARAINYLPGSDKSRRWQRVRRADADC